MPLNYNDYKRFRQKHSGISALSTVRALRSNASLVPIEWEDNRDGTQHCHMEIDNFDVHVRTDYDYDYDWSDFLGNFSSKWKPGAIRNPNSLNDSRKCEWFHPAITEEQHYKDLRRYFDKQTARNLAREYVRDAMKTVADPDSQDMYALYIKATVCRKGIELGFASVISDFKNTSEYREDNEIYLNELAWQVIHEALEEAKTNLEELQKLSTAH